MTPLGIRAVLAVAGALEKRLSIVLFHRVLAAPDTLLVNEPDIRRFAEQLTWLRSAFTILPLNQALDDLFDNRLPSGALAITFDDGYRDNENHALPVLRAFRIPATFFVTTRYIESGMMWNDRVVEAVRQWPHTAVDLRSLDLGYHECNSGRTMIMENILGQLKYKPHAERDALADEIYARSGARNGRMMMDESEIRSLRAAGMEIGGHTVSHPILSSLDTEDAEREIKDNKVSLEAIIGESLSTFAYPNGKPSRDYDYAHVDMVRQSGYSQALTTSAGAATATTPRHQIPRFTPWDRRPLKYLGRMVVNYFQAPTLVTKSN